MALEVLVQDISQSIKELQAAFLANGGATAINESQTAVLALLARLDSLFMHGLDKRFANKECYWDYVQRFCRKDVVREINRLKLVRTGRGRSRAFLRHALNEYSMEAYLNMVVEDVVYKGRYYAAEAHLFNREGIELLSMILSGLETLAFDLNLDSSSLDPVKAGGGIVATADALPSAATSTRSRTNSGANGSPAQASSEAVPSPDPIEPPSPARSLATPLATVGASGVVSEVTSLPATLEATEPDQSQPHNLQRAITPPTTMTTGPLISTSALEDTGPKGAQPRPSPPAPIASELAEEEVHSEPNVADDDRTSLRPDTLTARHARAEDTAHTVAPTSNESALVSDAVTAASAPTIPNTVASSIAEQPSDLVEDGESWVDRRAAEYELRREAAPAAMGTAQHDSNDDKPDAFEQKIEAMLASPVRKIESSTFAEMPISPEVSENATGALPLEADAQANTTDTEELSATGDTSPLPSPSPSPAVQATATASDSTNSLPLLSIEALQGSLAGTHAVNSVAESDDQSFYASLMLELLHPPDNDIIDIFHVRTYDGPRERHARLIITPHKVFVARKSVMTTQTVFELEIALDLLRLIDVCLNGLGLELHYQYSNRQIRRFAAFTGDKQCTQAIIQAIMRACEQSNVLEANFGTCKHQALAYYAMPARACGMLKASESEHNAGGESAMLWLVLDVSMQMLMACRVGSVVLQGRIVCKRENLITTEWKPYLLALRGDALEQMSFK
ncbi:uncharacterized protein MONBRDRAFT_22573, partial [Monosiga brevicollis MX1]